MLGAEMHVHLAEETERRLGNHRNGRSRKTVDTGSERLMLDTPRDRQGRFDPVLIGKYQRRFPGFDEKIIAMVARGLSTRDIQAHIAELYGIEISPALLSAVTDAVLEEVSAWQNRPQEPVYAIVYFDALRVKIRDEGLVRNKAVFLAIGVNCHGNKDVLGLWIEQTEGARFWLRVMNELKARGTQDVLIAVVDGLKGLPEAITAAFPECVVQTCIVHLLRNSLQFASWRERGAMARALNAIYGAASAEAAGAELDRFEAGPWGQKYPPVVQIWRRRRAEVIPLLRLLPGGAEAHLHHQCDRGPAQPGTQGGSKQGPFPQRQSGHQADVSGSAKHHRKVESRPKEWHNAKTQFAIQFGKRFLLAARNRETG